MDKDKIKKLAELFTTMSADDKPDDKATDTPAEKAPKEKKPRKKRTYTEEQKQELAERMRKMREKSLEKRQAKAVENKNNKPKKVQEEVKELKTKMSDIDILKNEINNLKATISKSKEEKEPPIKEPIKPLLSTTPEKAPPKQNAVVKETPKPIVKLPPPPPPKPEPSVRDILNLYGKRKRY
jgi:hypothetical protein